MFAAAHLEILEMDYGRPAGVFHYVFRGVDARNLDPAGVYLGLKQVGGDGRIEHVEGVFAVELNEFKIVVMIEELNAELLRGFGNLADALDGGGEAVGAGAAFLGQIGHGDIFAAYLGVVGEHLLGVGKHIVIGHMGRDGHDADLIAEFPDLGRLLTEKTREFNAVIAVFFHFFDRSVKIILHLIPDGVELDCYGQFHCRILPYNMYINILSYL